MVNLLLKKWYEPAPSNQYHFSTLVQQTLSVIGQYGGVRAQQLWALLCQTGPFSLVDQKLYATFLRALGEREIIHQTSDGQIVLGYNGEKIVDHYTFYTAFNTPEEYRLESNGRILGTIPIDKPLTVGQLVIFAGKRWEVLHVNAEKKLITLKRAKGGRPPQFGGDGQMVHDIVRQEMRRVYHEKSMPIYLNEDAKSLFNEGVECYDNLQLDNSQVLQIGNTIHVLTWLGDQIVSTITILLRSKGLSANCFAGIIDISNCSLEKFVETVKEILKESKLTPFELANLIPDTIVEKHDPILPKEIRDLGYGVRFFDVEGALKLLSQINTTIM
jgi:ATP-dependent Lhr-like helicase